jgi:DNA-binding NarL/FixJ family response regulator
MAPVNPLRVAIIEESPQARARLQALIDATPSPGFAGAADSVAAPPPNVVVIDVEPATSDVLKAEPDIWRAQPVLVLLTDDAYDDWISEGLPFDGTAILPRSAAPAEIVAAIEAAVHVCCRPGSALSC